MVGMLQLINEQSGTKPNLATQFGSFFCDIYNALKKHVQYESNNNAIKYYGSVIPHAWYMNFEKFGGLPTVVAFWENWLPRQGKIFFQSISPNEFGEVPHTIGCKTPLGTAITNRRDIDHSNCV